MITVTYTDRRTGEIKTIQHDETWDAEYGAFQWSQNNRSCDGRRADEMYDNSVKMALGCTWNDENLITVVILDDSGTEVYRDPVFPELTRYEALRRSAGTLLDMPKNCRRGDFADMMLEPAQWVLEQLTPMPESAKEDLLEILEELIAALKAQEGVDMSPRLDRAVQELSDRMYS